jgi:hypothetical protein
MAWGDLLNLQVFGLTLWDIVEVLTALIPDTMVPVLIDMTDLLDQPEMSAFALVYYARLQDGDGKSELSLAAQQTLYHMLEIQRRSAQIALDWANSQDPPPADIVAQAERALQRTAMHAHIAGVGNADYNPYGFTIGLQDALNFEAVLNRGDSTPYALKTDDEIWATIENALAGAADRPLVVERYWARFPTPADRPMWRQDDHYRVQGIDGAWQEIPNISHQWFGGVHLWNDAPMCALAPGVLDCTWALLGCERPDLDASGQVDAADQALFDAAWTLYGEGATCDAGNSWCDGADLDHGGVLDADDAAYMTAAQGCWY